MEEKVLEYKSQEYGLHFENIEYLSVTKNSKGINWEVKILGTDVDKLKNITDKLESIYSRR